MPQQLEHWELLSILSYDPASGIFRRRASKQRPDVVGEIANRDGPDGYARVSVLRKWYRAHRLAWFYVHGVWPADQLDHIDGNRMSCAIANLREANNAENQQNRTDFGVTWKKQHGRWNARITINGKRIELGLFDSKQDARDAYLAAKKDIHPFASRCFE